MYYLIYKKSEKELDVISTSGTLTGAQKSLINIKNKMIQHNRGSDAHKVRIFQEVK